MATRRLRENDLGAILAVVAGVLFLLVGWTGARGVDHFFDLLVAILGPNPLLRVLAIIFVSIASLGGIAVLAGAWLLHRDRVVTANVVILLGTGAGIISLALFVILLIARPGRILPQEGVIPVLIGVALSVAARIVARPRIRR